MNSNKDTAKKWEGYYRTETKHGTASWVPFNSATVTRMGNVYIADGIGLQLNGVINCEGKFSEFMSEGGRYVGDIEFSSKGCEYSFAGRIRDNTQPHGYLDFRGSIVD